VVFTFLRGRVIASLLPLQVASATRPQSDRIVGECVMGHSSHSFRFIHATQRPGGLARSTETLNLANLSILPSCLSKHGSSSDVFLAASLCTCT